MAQEGLPFVVAYIVGADKGIYLNSLFFILLFFFYWILFPKTKGFRWGIFVPLVFLGLERHYSIVNKLGLYQEKSWNEFKIPRRVYDVFHDSNKNMKLCGFMEYGLRDFYVSFLKRKQKPSKDEVRLLERYYDYPSLHSPNNYTGILSGMNLIILQMEGMERWLINNSTTPHLLSLLQESYDFINHFSFDASAGATFNSEFCVNTGFLPPVTFSFNPYQMTTTQFVCSLPKMFDLYNYSSNAFHMNSREFYNRGLNYMNWGYKRFYSLLDDTNVS